VTFATARAIAFFTRHLLDDKDLFLTSNFQIHNPITHGRFSVVTLLSLEKTLKNLRGPS